MSGALAPADRDWMWVSRRRLKGSRLAANSVDAGADNEENGVEDVGDGGDGAGRGRRRGGSGEKGGCTLDLGG